MEAPVYSDMLMNLKFIRKYINNKTIKFILFIVVLFRKIKQSSAHLYVVITILYWKIKYIELFNEIYYNNSLSHRM